MELQQWWWLSKCINFWWLKTLCKYHKRSAPPPMQSSNKREKQWNRSEFWAAFHWPIKEDFTFLWLIQARAGSLSLASAFTLHSAEFIMSLSHNVNMIYCAPRASLPRRKPSGKENLLSKQKTSKQMALRQLSWWKIQSATLSPFLMQIFHLLFRLVLYFFWRQTLSWSAQAGWQVCTGKSWQMQSERHSACNAFTS